MTASDRDYPTVVVHARCRSSVLRVNRRYPDVAHVGLGNGRFMEMNRLAILGSHRYRRELRISEPKDVRQDLPGDHLGDSFDVEGFPSVDGSNS